MKKKYKYKLTVFCKGGNQFEFSNFFDADIVIPLEEWGVPFLNWFYNECKLDSDYYEYKDKSDDEKEERIVVIIRKNISFFTLEKGVV